MTVDQIIRGAIPDAPDELCSYILWNRTAYPFKKLSARELYKAASGFRRASEKKIFLCDHCSNRADHDDFECCRCYAARNAEPEN